MMKCINWFNKRTPAQQVALLVALLPCIGGIAGGLFLVISNVAVALINNREPRHIEQAINNQQALVLQETIKRPEYNQHPGVKRINADVYEYLKQIDNKPDTSENQRLLDIVFEHLNNSINTDPNDGETSFLYAEAYLRNHNYNDAIHHYDTALDKQYFFDGDVYFGYGYIYEAFGDQHISNNDLSSADIYYKRSIEYFILATNAQYLSYRNVDEIKNMLLRVEYKKENYNFAEEYFTSFSAINKDSNNIQNIPMVIDLATNYADLKLWKNAVRCYYWLFKQNTTGQRRLGIIRDFQYFSDFWEFSDDFENDISINSVKAVINNENVNFRQEPIIDNNTIRELNLFEEVQILQRSNFRQSIGNVRTYWYKIFTDDGIEGWVYGQYLCFYPDFKFR